MIGVYLLVNNDGGGGVGYLYSLQQSIVEPDSNDKSSGKKGGGWCQGCG